MWKIDISQVPEDKRTHPDFLALQKDMQTRLADERMIDAICTHEAAHLIFYQPAGSADPVFIGPRICYDAQRDSFDGYGAMVKFNGRDDNILSRLTQSQWVRAYAKGCAAGGVAARELAAASDDGSDEDDFKNLCDFCKALSFKATAGASGPDFASIWRQGQADIHEELQNSRTRDAVRTVAEKLKAYFADNL